LKTVDAVAGGPEAPLDHDLAPGAGPAGVIPDHVAGQRASPEARARVVPSPDQSLVLDPRAVIPVTNPNLDPQARRRTRSPDPVHAPDPSPGIKVVPEVSAKNVVTETQEVAPRALTKMEIVLLTGHQKRMTLAMISNITKYTYLHM
jgi:hypothetical protein